VNNALFRFQIPDDDEDVLKDDDGDPVTPNFSFDPADMDLLAIPGKAFDKAEEIARKVEFLCAHLGVKTRLSISWENALCDWLR
jgi:hypothetical protein